MKSVIGRPRFITRQVVSTVHTTRSDGCTLFRLALICGHEADFLVPSASALPPKVCFCRKCAKRPVAQFVLRG